MTSSGTTDFAHGAPGDGSSLSQQGQPHELGANQRGMTPTDDGAGGEMHRANSSMSQSHTLTPSRGGTLKKKQSLKRSGSKRTGSRRNSFAGSIKGLAVGDQQYDGADDEQMNSAFFTPVPTTGSPTEILANRFQGKLSAFSVPFLADSFQHGARFSKT